MPTHNQFTPGRPVVGNKPKFVDAEIDFHKGSVLGYLARTYPFLDEAIYEAVQNSIDAGARKITVSINKAASARNITICDDGHGASDEFFRSCLVSIGASKKKPGKIGQFGLGVVASYGKCESFSFTSEPSDHKNGMLEWTFDCEALRTQNKGLKAPVREVKLPTKEWWRSKLFIDKFETDKIRASLDIETLCDGILSRYNEHLQAYKTKITIKITEKDGSVDQRTIEYMEYTGSPLPVKIYESDVSGRTELRLFLAKPKTLNRRSVFKGVIRVKSGNNSGIILNEKNAEKAVAGLLNKDAMAKLTSGIFEGIINFDGEKVKMDPSRIRMVESDELLDACSKIERWMTEDGQQHIDKVEDESKDERYERLGKRSLRMLKFLYKKDSDIGQLIRSFQEGSTGSGHTKVSGTGDEIRATSSDGGSEKSKEGSDDDRERKAPKKERPDHTPTTVISKTGRARKVVSENSLGIHLAFGRVDSTWLWELDPKKGILTINIYHYLWAGVENAHERESAREKCLMDLQERIILYALRLHQWETKFTNTDGDIDTNFVFVEDAIKKLIEDEIPLITHADKLTKRGQFYNRLAKKAEGETDEGGE
jgi:hypothetical protein